MHPDRAQASPRRRRRISPRTAGNVICGWISTRTSPARWQYAALSRGDGLAMYQTTHALHRALRDHVRLPEEMIRVTAGADEGIYGLMRAYVDQGDTVLLPWPTFVEFPTAAAAVGARMIKVPYGPDLIFPLERFRAELAHRPRAAVLVTPANPTGDLIAPRTVLASGSGRPGDPADCG